MIHRNKGLSNPLSALKHRDFAIYAAGMCFSLIGTWMQNVAQPLLAYNITNSSSLVGLVSAMQFLPVLFLSLFSGVVIDRLSKKKILFITQSASLLVTLVLAVLVWAKVVQYWHILTCSLLLGIINTLDMPTRQTFVIELVGRDSLMNAIAINSSIFNVARVAGPALAGLVMATMGMFACFLFNSISFAAVIASLFFVHPKETPLMENKGQKVWQNVREGLGYIAKNETVLRTLSGIFTVNGFAMSTSVLLTAFAKHVLAHGSLEYENYFNMLVMIMGVGSFLGAMYVASSSRHGPDQFIMKVFPLIIASTLLLASFATSFWMIAALMATQGFLFVSFSSTANSTVQFNTQDQYRGRVMSVFSLLSGGASPLGNLYTGALVQSFGVRTGFRGTSGIIFALLFVSSLIWRKKDNKKATGTKDANVRD